MLSLLRVHREEAGVGHPVMQGCSFSLVCSNPGEHFKDVSHRGQDRGPPRDLPHRPSREHPPPLSSWFLGWHLGASLAGSISPLL